MAIWGDVEMILNEDLEDNIIPEESCRKQIR
jgi:hypothetical protein